MDFKRNLEKYAELSVKTGINVQPGETLLVRSPIECADFTRAAVRYAYECGAKRVHVEWSDDDCTLSTYKLAPSDSFNEYPQWQADKYTSIAEEGGSFLTVSATDPDLLKDVDPQRIADFQKASGKALKKWRSYTLTDKCKWSIVSCPTEKWAQKVYPDETPENAVKMLWDAIFKCTRADLENPVEEWKKHNLSLKEKTDFLNNADFKALHFKSDKTDLEIKLPDGHIWQSGNAYDPSGVEFTPNIPTEEIYGMPHKFGVNGTVFSTKPLVFGGNIIDNFSITFKDGKIIDFSAEKGFETLKKLIETDEGSHYIGEVALVPFNSPISDTNTVFFNTLFDENASCHLAIGAAYRTNIKDGENIPDNMLDEKGVNDSMAHVDFMIGSSDMNITGIKSDGETVDIFINGNWAF
ncbi:aminopeptidase [Peptacetobacter hominis]|uniref:Aminopeptidase n=1 Tax=Peptacetobacter hominis TaxID=2743610 RepID=A0A544QV08_9FIRM|nr:aminopeptidase [Peptacetobacter hominis]TQQ84525.1 aminopeptidase [Peptacetobacter hominis]